MTSATLQHILEYPNASRKYRLEAAQWVLEHPDHFPELLETAVKDNGPVAFRAAWAMEFVCLEQPELLYRHLDRFSSCLSELKNNTTIRVFSHICEMLCLLYYKAKDPQLHKRLSVMHKQAWTTVCFDWLLNDMKVACQVRAMTVLYYLGTETPWIHKELKPILERSIHSGSAGYRARGKKILKAVL